MSESEKRGSNDAPTLERGLSLHGQDRLDEAEAVYRALIDHDSADPDAHHLLGQIALRKQQPERALALITTAIRLAPDDERYHASQANVLRSMGRFEEAQVSLAACLAIKPDHVEAIMSLGFLFAHLGQHDKARRQFDQASTHRPNDITILMARGTLLAEMNLPAEAVTDFTAVLALNPSHPMAYQRRAMALHTLGRNTEALADLEYVTRLQPDNAAAYAIQGDVLGKMARPADALTLYDKAIALGLISAGLHNSRGLALLDMGRFSDALASFDKAIALAPEMIEARYNRAQALSAMKQFDDAAKSFNAILAAGQTYPYLRGNAFAAQLHACDWTEYTATAQKIAHDVAAGVRVDTPFNFLLHSDSPALQLQAARIYVTAEAAGSSAPQAVRRSSPPDKIRIGYLSSDFNNHATALLAAGLFETHDRTRFEVTAFSSSIDDGSAMHQRLRKAFDQFIDVRAMSDADAATLISDREIDILVDLKGHTAHNRLGILAYRPAPLQIHYLGFPGTIGADYIDYLLADHHLIPPEHHQHYAEKIVYLQGTYQVNDATRPTPALHADRTKYGLPPIGFVFCSFNNSMKITPTVFDVWMRLLKTVENSVLWLLADTSDAERRLKQEATARGVAVERLIFAPRMALNDHMARHTCADLFLDTLPCNAHTTASDALWCGVPIITCSGQTFAGRVCGSLLKAAGLPELVTTSLDEYEKYALRLATAPSELAAIKAKLSARRHTSPVFDLAQHRRGIEAAYMMMWDRHMRGLPPADFGVVESP